MESTDHQDNMSVRVASFSCYLNPSKQNSVNRSVNSAQESPILSNSPKTTKPPKTNHNLSSHSIQNHSFSYLNAAGENLVFKLPENPIKDAFTFSHQIPNKDAEISVFGADNYFNMKLEYKQQQKNKEWPVNLTRTESNKGLRNPSLCSEASTLNSQTPLLSNVIQRSRSQTKQKRALGKRIFGGLGCRGPCFQSKDVHINTIVAPYGSKPTPTGMPVPIVQKQVKEVKELEDEPRKSIEVFGSAKLISKGDDVAKKMERKLSVLTWDAIPNKEKPPPSSSTMCDDMASDASSDLFEIEHISGSLYPLLPEELAIDDMSSCMSPQSHYAPSEASIQWSVVTASAADYSSVLSDYNNEMSVSVAGDAIARNYLKKMNSKTRNGVGKEAQKSRGAGLLGCKSYKAVDVVAENVRCKNNEKPKH